MFDNLYVAAITAYPVAFRGEKGSVSDTGVSYKSEEAKYVSGKMQIETNKTANRRMYWNLLYSMSFKYYKRIRV